MMNDVTSSGGSRPSAARALPLVTAAVALAVGIAGMVTGIAARRELRTLRAEIDDVRATIPTRAEEPARNLAGQVNRALDTIVKRMNDTDLRITELARRLAEVAAQERKPAVATLPPAAAAPPAAPQPATASPSAPSPSTTYTVESGDTLGAIAKKLGVSLNALQQANPDVNPSKLKVGQKLNVP